jgi:hypothetical protein
MKINCYKKCFSDKDVTLFLFLFQVFLDVNLLNVNRAPKGGKNRVCGVKTARFEAGELMLKLERRR